MIERLRVEKSFRNPHELDSVSVQNLMYVVNNGANISKKFLSIKNKGYMNEDEIKQLQEYAKSAAAAVIGLEGLYHVVLTSGSEPEEIDY